MSPNDSSDMNENVYKSDAKPEKKQGGAHAKAAQSAYMQRSSRMRKVLIVVICVLLVLLLAGIGFFGFKIFQSRRRTPRCSRRRGLRRQHDHRRRRGQRRIRQHVEEDDRPRPGGAALGTPRRRPSPCCSTAPRSPAPWRSTRRRQPGAPRASGGACRRRAVRLAQRHAYRVPEPERGRQAVIESGYSAATSSLGYGSVSFTDAVQNEHIVEETLAEAGLTVSYGTAQLPEDKMLYSTYDTDGTTLVKEYCSFNGTGMADGVEHGWDAILSYDYSVANATDNLNDTIRTIYIYIS